MSKVASVMTDMASSMGWRVGGGEACFLTNFTISGSSWTPRCAISLHYPPRGAVWQGRVHRTTRCNNSCKKNSKFNSYWSPSQVTVFCIIAGICRGLWRNEVMRSKIRVWNIFLSTVIVHESPHWCFLHTSQFT